MSRDAQTIEKARDAMRSWAKIADFLDHNRDIASEATWYPGYVLVCCVHVQDPAAVIAEYANRASAAGARIVSDINVEHAGLNAWFGKAYISFYAQSEQVCEGAPDAPSLVGPLTALAAESAASLGETR